MTEKFSVPELTALRTELLQGFDCKDATELVQMFLAGHGYGVSAEEARNAVSRAKQTLIDDFERGYLERLLARTGSNVSRAAALAGIGRHTLRELMRRHGFRGDD